LNVRGSAGFGQRNRDRTGKTLLGGFFHLGKSNSQSELIISVMPKALLGFLAGLWRTSDHLNFNTINEKTLPHAGGF
jgi:hypothetical protein